MAITCQARFHGRTLLSLSRTCHGKGWEGSACAHTEREASWRPHLCSLQGSTEMLLYNAHVQGPQNRTHPQQTAPWTRTAGSR